MAQVLEQLRGCPVRTRLSLSGTLVVARDIAHAKLQVGLASHTLKSQCLPPAGQNVFLITPHGQKYVLSVSWAFLFSSACSGCFRHFRLSPMVYWPPIEFSGSKLTLLVGLKFWEFCAWVRVF
jgi:hypothetical protein